MPRIWPIWLPVGKGDALIRVALVSPKEIRGLIPQSEAWDVPDAPGHVDFFFFFFDGRGLTRPNLNLKFLGVFLASSQFRRFMQPPHLIDMDRTKHS